MGNSQASNILNNTINQSISILNRTVQKCETSLSQQQGIDINGCSGDVIIRNVNFNQSGTIDIQCAQSSSSTNEITDEIKTNFEQSAEAINQALSLNPGSTDANNVTNLMQQLALDVVNTYSQTCIGGTVQSQQITRTCPATGGGNTTIEQVNFDQVSNGTSSCTQDAINDNSAKLSIENIISQKARAVVEPILGLGALILIVIIVVIVLFMTGASSITSIIVIIIVIAVGIGIYLLIAWIVKIFPFASTSVDNQGTTASPS